MELTIFDVEHGACLRQRHSDDDRLWPQWVMAGDQAGRLKPPPFVLQPGSAVSVLPPTPT